MSADHSSLWVFVYDITSDTEREKISLILSDNGFRVQKSVFECLLRQDQAENLFLLLEKHITPRDSLIAFPLCASCLKKYRVLGKKKWFDWDKDFLIVEF